MVGGTESKNVERVEEHNPSTTESNLVRLIFFTPKKERLKTTVVCLVNQHFLTCDRRR